MTAAQLGREMDYSEFVEWMALDELRAHEAEQAQKRAKKGMRSTRHRRG